MFIDSVATYFISAVRWFQGGSGSASDFCLLFVVVVRAIGAPPPSEFLEKLSGNSNCFFWYLLSFQRSPEDAAFDAAVSYEESERAVVVVCAVAQIIGGGFSAGEGKLRLTPGRRARRDASFPFSTSARKKTKQQSRSNGFQQEVSGLHRAAGRTRPLLPPTPVLPTSPSSPSINLSYPGLNMSRVDVTLRLCLSSGEGPVEVKCSAVCDSGETEGRGREEGGR